MERNDRAKGNNLVRGGQITFHNIRMWMQVHFTIFKYVMCVVLVLTPIVAIINAPDNTATAIFYYTKYNLHYALGAEPYSKVVTYWDNQAFTSTLINQIQNPTLINLTHKFIYDIQVILLILVALGMVAISFIGRYFQSKGGDKAQDHFIRGIQKAQPKELTKHLKKKGNKVSDCKLDGHQIFKLNFEVQHLLVDGTTGVGKSVLIRKFLMWVRERGDKAIIYDKGCTFVGSLYNPQTDVILNPFDDRCANWTVWNDAKEAPDYESMANALIPQHGEGDPFWVDSARSIFSTTAFQMSKDTENKPTTERLLDLILTSSIETLGTFLKGTESETLVSNKIEKTAISIKSVLATYIKSLRFLDGLDDTDKDGNPIRPDFSITDWVQDDNQRGFLFLSSNAMQHASLRPLISMWLAIASNAILGLEENEDRRIWVVMDEMPSLHKLPELGSIIAEVRKFGGCYLIGIQSYAQLVKTYGKHAADEMFDLLNSRFYFRAPSAEMAQISAKDLGEQEIDVSRENYSYGANTLRDGVTLSHQTITRPVVSASEIQTLDDLQCWARVPNSSFITRLDLQIDPKKKQNTPFLKRQYQESDSMKEVYEKLVYHEIRAPMMLDEADRSALFTRQSETFENENEQQSEVEQMKQAIENSDKREQKTRHQQNESDRVQREVDEASLSQDFEL